jgi:CheY-like chemotaxis protein
LFRKKPPRFGNGGFSKIKKCGAGYLAQSSLDFDPAFFSFILVRTILIVDDEESILGLMKKALTAADCTILTARSSDEAFQVSRYYRERIHLLVTDIKMDPYMSGSELAQCMRQLAGNKGAVRIGLCAGRRGPGRSGNGGSRFPRQAIQSRRLAFENAAHGRASHGLKETNVSGFNPG